MLEVSKMNTIGKILLTAVLSAVFVLIAVPFKIMALTPGFTEIRPVNCLNMLYGLIFGFYGGLGCAVGNIISDILGGTLAISSWAGFVSNFAGAYIPYLLWYRIAGRRPYADTFGQTALYTLLTLLSGALSAGLISFAVHLSYPETDSFSIFIQVILNTVIFSMLLGLPLLITAENEYNIIGSVPASIKESDINEHK